jgi:hypothetical protein
VPDPQLASDQVLMQIEAFSINRGELGPFARRPETGTRSLRSIWTRWSPRPRRRRTASMQFLSTPGGGAPHGPDGLADVRMLDGYRLELIESSALERGLQRSRWVSVCARRHLVGLISLWN